MCTMPPPMLPLRREATPAERAAYRHAKIEEAKSRRFMATIIVIAGLLATGIVCVLGALLWYEFGWRGPAWAVLIVGLLAVAVLEVEKRL